MSNDYKLCFDCGRRINVKRFKFCDGCLEKRLEEERGFDWTMWCYEEDEED